MGEVEAEAVKQPKLEIESLWPGQRNADVGGNAVSATLYACQLKSSPKVNRLAAHVTQLGPADIVTDHVAVSCDANPSG